MTTMYGIKNCDTVKKARQWLDKHAITYHFHDFRVEGLTSDKIQQWLQTQPLEKLVNKQSTTWKQLTDDEKASLTIDSAIALCLQHPTLIKRPVLEYDGAIHLGFKETHYQSLFQ